MKTVYVYLQLVLFISFSLNALGEEVGKKNLLNPNSVMMLKDLLLYIPPYLQESAPEIIFDEIGSHEKLGDLAHLEVPFGHRKLHRGVYSNGDGTYSIVDGYTPSVGGDAAFGVPSLVMSGGEKLLVIRQTNDIYNLSKQPANDEVFAQKTQNGFKAWAFSMAHLPQNIPHSFREVNRRRDDLAHYNYNPLQSDTNVTALLDLARKNNSDLASALQGPEMKSFSQATDHPVRAEELLSTEYKSGDIVAMCADGDGGFGLSSPGFFAFAVGGKMFVRDRWCVTVMKENNGYARVKIESSPKEAGKEYDASIGVYALDPSIVVSLATQALGFWPLVISRAQSTSHIFDHIYRYNLNTICGRAAYNSAVALEMILSEKCSDENLGVEELVYDREILRNDPKSKTSDGAQKTNTDHAINSRITHLGFLKLDKSQGVDCSSISVQFHENNKKTLQFTCLGVQNRSRSFWFFGRHKNQQTVQTSATTTLSPTDPTQGDITTIAASYTFVKNKVNDRTFGDILKFATQATGHVYDLTYENISGPTNVALDVRFGAEASTQIVNTGVNQLWSALADAVGVPESYKQGWMTEETRHTWIRDASNNHWICDNVNSLLGKHASCANLYLAADNLVRKFQRIQEASTVTDRIRRLNEFLKSSSTHPIVIRTLIELAQGLPTETRLHIENGIFQHGYIDHFEGALRDRPDNSPLTGPRVDSAALAP